MEICWRVGRLYLGPNGVILRLVETALPPEPFRFEAVLGGNTVEVQAEHIQQELKADDIQQILADWQARYGDMPAANQNAGAVRRAWARANMSGAYAE